MNNKNPWYGFFPIGKDKPICITKNLNWLKNIIEDSEPKKIENPKHLQYLVKTNEENLLQASFEFEPHAMKYQTEVLRISKSYREPNPSYGENKK